MSSKENNNNNNSNNNNNNNSNESKKKVNKRGTSKNNNKNNKNKSNNNNNNKDVLKPISKSDLAKLTFPVARIRRYMKDGGYSSRVTLSAAVCLAGILEYLAVEIIELSGNAAKENKQMRIKPRWIKLAVSADDELAALLQHAIIRDGGVTPGIHPNLTMSKNNKNKGKGGKNSGKQNSGSGSGSGNQKTQESQEY